MKEIKENIYADVENERILIRQAKQGYKPAFTKLITLYQQKVFGLAYKFFQDRDDAMEIVQETFIRLHQKLDTFDENDSKTRFNNWVYRIAYNLCIDYYRKYKKKKADMKDIYDFNEDSRTDSTNPEDELDRERFRHSLEKHVMKLSKRQKSVFMLRHYSGLKHHEIADTLGLSIGTVKSLYHRAVLSLKKWMVEIHPVRLEELRREEAG
jgi:RNA polymerase sigma-70 factor (ECF subfamily)